jgi:hypothetical protein
LPNVGRQFAANTDAILRTLNEVQGNNPTPQQRQEISRLLEQLTDGLLQSESQLESGVSELGGFLRQQEDWARWITDAKNNLVVRNALEQSGCRAADGSSGDAA